MEFTVCVRSVFLPYSHVDKVGCNAIFFCNKIPFVSEKVVFEKFNSESVEYKGIRERLPQWYVCSLISRWHVEVDDAKSTVCAYVAESI